MNETNLGAFVELESLEAMLRDRKANSAEAETEELSNE